MGRKTVKLHISFGLLNFSVFCCRQNIENFVPIETPEQESVLFPEEEDNLTCGECSVHTIKQYITGFLYFIKTLAQTV
jgi:hypothetical protein